MPYELVNNFPNDILLEKEGPFISLYQPTFRQSPDNKQDVIRFKNLVKTIENSLSQKYSKAEVAKLLEPFTEIAEDKSFWINALDGLGILSCKNKTVVYKLPRQVEELAVVSGSFHIKPLLRHFQSMDRYQILGLSRKNFVLYEGNRYGFNEIQLDESIPRTMVEVLGDQRTEPSLNASRYGGGTAGSAMLHGLGGKKEEVSKDVDKYFRYVDKLVKENYSHASRLPLILLSLPENQGVFRGISDNTYLLEEGIKKDYEELKEIDIQNEAWKVIEPLLLEKTKTLVDKFENIRAQFTGSDDLSQVARAAFEDRVETLLVESGLVIPGKINLENGEITQENLENPEIDDVLDDLAQLVIAHRGNVVVLPKERMPSKTGIAAIFRY